MCRVNATLTQTQLTSLPKTPRIWKKKKKIEIIAQKSLRRGDACQQLPRLHKIRQQIQCIQTKRSAHFCKQRTGSNLLNCFIAKKEAWSKLRPLELASQTFSKAWLPALSCFGYYAFARSKALPLKPDRDSGAQTGFLATLLRAHVWVCVSSS